jgi:glycosyltransferase involved in cell wall biosynthesis
MTETAATETIVPVERPTVSGVICTHLEERLPWLKESVDSLSSQRVGLSEVVVVVDGDETLAAAVRRQVGVRVLSTGVRSGLSVARNLGVAAVDSDVVVFLDDDARADPEWVRALVDTMRPDVIGSCGRSLPIWGGDRPKWLPNEFLWAFGCSWHGLPDSRAIVRNVIGGCAAIRRKEFLEIGGYSPDFGYAPGRHGGGEEAELCLRMVQEWPDRYFIFEPDAVIHHRIPAERMTRRYFVRRCFAEGRAKQEIAASSTGSSALMPERQFAYDLLQELGSCVRSVARGRVSRIHQVAGLLLGAVATTAGAVTEMLAGSSLRRLHRTWSR